MIRYTWEVYVTSTPAAATAATATAAATDRCPSVLRVSCLHCCDQTGLLIENHKIRRASYCCNTYLVQQYTQSFGLLFLWKKFLSLVFRAFCFVFPFDKNRMHFKPGICSGLTRSMHDALWRLMYVLSVHIHRAVPNSKFVIRSILIALVRVLSFLRARIAKDTLGSKRFIFFKIELNSIRFGGNIRIYLRPTGN